MSCLCQQSWFVSFFEFVVLCCAVLWLFCQCLLGMVKLCRCKVVTLMYMSTSHSLIVSSCNHCSSHTYTAHASINKYCRHLWSDNDATIVLLVDRPHMLITLHYTTLSKPFLVSSCVRLLYWPPPTMILSMQYWLGTDLWICIGCVGRLLFFAWYRTHKAY